MREQPAWRRLLAGSLLAGSLLFARARVEGQTVPPPAPIDGSPPTVSAPPVLGQPIPFSAPSPSPLIVQPTPLTYQAPPPPGAPVVDPFLDPGTNGWAPFGFASADPGWFFDVQVAVVFPRLKFDVTNDTPLPQTGMQLHVPSVDLSTTVAPTFELGYVLGGSNGFFAVNYGFLISEGTGTTAINGENFNVRTRAVLNAFSFDYGTTPYEVAPRWELAWRIGIRAADIFFDSSATTSWMKQQASSHFTGAGPHAQIELERRIVPVTGLALYCRGDAAGLIGQVEQNFRVEVPPGSGALVDTGSVRGTQFVPYLNAQAGLSYRPPSFALLKLTAGYEISEYFNCGRLGVNGTGEVSRSRGSLGWHGAFLRGQVDY